MPLPGLYGVKSVSQRGTPAAVGVVRIPFTVNFASRTCAPWNARPGVPMGTSGGGRLPAPCQEEDAVQISQVLRHKGREVATIDGSDDVRTTRFMRRCAACS